MDTKTSTDYEVDNRYRGLEKASDNIEGKKFLAKYLERRGAPSGQSLTEQRKEDNRFVTSAPGWNTLYTFKNAFSSPRSPSQRRLEQALR